MKIKNEILSTTKPKCKFEDFRSPDDSPPRPIVAVSPTKRVKDQTYFVQVQTPTPTVQKAPKFKKTEKLSFVQNKKQFFQKKVGKVEPFNISGQQPFGLTMNKNQLFDEIHLKSTYTPYVHDEKPFCTSKFL